MNWEAKEEGRGGADSGAFVVRGIFGVRELEDVEDSCCLGLGLGSSSIRKRSMGADGCWECVNCRDISGLDCAYAGIGVGFAPLVKVGFGRAVSGPGCAGGIFIQSTKPGDDCNSF